MQVFLKFAFHAHREFYWFCSFHATQALFRFVRFFVCLFFSSDVNPNDFPVIFVRNELYFKNERMDINRDAKFLGLSAYKILKL